MVPSVGSCVQRYMEDDRLLGIIIRGISPRELVSIPRLLQLIM